jgi:hypothetical protein
MLNFFRHIVIWDSFNVLAFSLDKLLLAPRNGVTDCAPINSHCPLHRFRHAMHTPFPFFCIRSRRRPLHIKWLGITFDVSTSACPCHTVFLSCPLQGNWCRTMLSKRQKREKSSGSIPITRFPSKCTCTNTFTVFSLTIQSRSAHDVFCR